MITAARPFREDEDVENPNAVKVVVDRAGQRALLLPQRSIREMPCAPQAQVSLTFCIRHLRLQS